MSQITNPYVTPLSNPSDILKGESLDKKLKLTYLEIRPNTVFVKPISLLNETSSGLMSPEGQLLKNNKEELVFIVIKAGKMTDTEFHLDVKEGDKILVSADYLNGVKHNPTTRVVSETGVNLWGYFTVPAAGIVAIVEYSKL